MKNKSSVPRDAGKHVFCEKPLAMNRAAAERAVVACEHPGVILGVGHERRFEPAMIEIKRMIDSGELGAVLHVESNFSHDILKDLPPDNWRVSDPFVPAGMTGMGIHLTDSYIQMFGPVERVYAQPARRVTEWKAGDIISVSFRFKSGVTGYLNSILATPFFMRYHVFGTEAWVEARDTVRPEAEGVVHFTFTVRRKGGNPIPRELPSINSVVANIEAFAAAVAGEVNLRLRARKRSEILPFSKPSRSRWRAKCGNSLILTASYPRKALQILKS